MAQDAGTPPQDVGAPPADVGNPNSGSPDTGGQDNGAPDTSGQDNGSPDAGASGGADDASLLVRVERLEDQVRQMNGQIEQMQFDARKLQDQLRKFQEDVDFRFQEGRGRARRQDSGALNPAPADQTGSLQRPEGAEADAASANSNDAGAPLQLGAPSSPQPSSGELAQPSSDELAQPSSGELAQPSSGRRHDAFDPNANPNAPGAPRQLGTTAPSAPLPPDSEGASASDSDAPLNLPSAGYAPPPATPAPTVQPASTGPSATPGATAMASAEVDPSKEEFDTALGYFKQKDYDAAEKGFSAFLEKNPKTRYTSDALFYLGETYYERGRSREAAEQYLKISTDYASSPRAPEAMLRLGESLQALGAKEQACATFGEVGRKYPNAAAAVKAGAEREAKRAQC